MSGTGATPGKAILPRWLLWTALATGLALGYWYAQRNGVGATLEEQIESKNWGMWI